MRKTASLRRTVSLLLCLALSLSLMIIPASANLMDDNLASKARAACSDFGLENGGEVAYGGKSIHNDKTGVYFINADTPQNGRDLLVVQLHTVQNGRGTIYFSLYYEGTDGKLHYTEEININDLTVDYMKGESFQAGKVSSMSFLLPTQVRRVLGVYFYKKDSSPLIIDWLTVARATSKIEEPTTDTSGNIFRNFQGQYIGSTTAMASGNDLVTDKKNTGAIFYLTRPSGVNAASSSTCVLELVAGSDGYVNKDGTVSINFTDTLGITQERSVNIREGYAAFQLNKEIKGAEKDFNHSYTSPWFDTSVREMQGLASGFTGNYYLYQGVSETCLRPYTSTEIPIIMPQNIAQINSISVSLWENDSLVLQSVRLIELDHLSDTNYWNGSYSLERVRSWSGTALAVSDGGPYTIPGGGSITFTANQGFEQRGLLTYNRGMGPTVDNQGEGVGVSIQLADVLGAGVESCLTFEYMAGATTFPAITSYKKKMGDAYWAWPYLDPVRAEFITLTLQYRDTLGATRQVSIPFHTTYLLYLFKEHQGNISGGGMESWPSGIFQQNENVALPLKLAQYDSLIGLRFSYGAAPDGLTFLTDDKEDSDYYAQLYYKVDTSSDPITVENICFYEGVTASNFNSKLDARTLSFLFKTSLSPAYSYSSSNPQGQQLSGGGSISASVADGTLVAGAPKGRDYTNKYLVRIKTADVETAGTTNPLTISLGYTDTAGAARTTSEYSVPTLAANFYGTSHRAFSTDIMDRQVRLTPAKHQYDRHMRRNCVCEFVLEIPDVATIDSINLSIDGSNEWQMEYVSVYQLHDLEQRWGERKVEENGAADIYWRREYTGTQIAIARQSVLLYANNPSRTVNFTTFTEDGTPIEPEQGTKTEDYLTSMPTTMTYDETKKNLGLSIVKYNYQVDVQVADVEDAGSANYFYFQLLFENGTSGVVLANQQLASDSFRQGMIESFQIKCTQNYGNVKSVRIICDNTSSQSDVFDKLNVEKITVTMSSSNGISKSWMVEKVGWVDISYVDEGADAGVNGLEELVDTRSSNVEVIKEFPVTRQATAVDLLFCISTSASSANDSANPLENALQGKFEATLVYRDSSGMEQSMNFDLTNKIQEYNDTNKTFWLYRPNHVDRFTLSMPDITSVISLLITRTGGRADTKWVIDNVSIQQVGGLGPVYLSPSMTEYIRDPNNTSDLAVSTNDQGISYMVSGGGNTAITFTENSIDVSSQEESGSWNATISRVPVLSSETLNIYLLPGSVIGSDYSFTASSPAIHATVKYTTVYGGSLVQNSFTIGNLGEINGQSVLYGKGLEVSAMSSLSSLVLSSTSTSGSQPYIGSAIVERSRGGVLMGTYYFNFGNYYLGNGNPEFSPSTTVMPTPMRQTLRLQPSADQAVALTAENNDVAVAIRYTSTLDPSESNKTVYQSPYVYLTDVGHTAITTGKFLDIPFEMGNVSEIVGMSIATTGPVVSFDNAIIYNYPTAQGTQEGGGTETGTETGQPPASAAPTDVCSLSMPFIANTLPTVYTENGQLVTPAKFRFTTSPEEAAAGAGTSGIVSMVVDYTDSLGSQRSMTFPNLFSYLPAGTTPVPGSTVELSLQLSDAVYLNSITLSGEDSWLLASVSAELSPPDGTTSVSSTTVNNWASNTSPLTIDMLPALYGGDNEGNQIQTFTVTGRGQIAQIAASGTASGTTGGSLLVTAYEGDTVDLTPVVSAVGEPDVTWTWNTGNAERYLNINSDGSASFTVPGNMMPGDSCTFSVACNGDKRLAVSITVAVEEEPEEELPPDYWGIGDGDEDSEGEISTEPTE